MPPSTLFAVGIAESSGATGIVTEAMMANRRLKLSGHLRFCRSRLETEPLSRPGLTHPDHRLVSRPERPSREAEGVWGETHGRNPPEWVALSGREVAQSLAAADTVSRDIAILQAALAASPRALRTFTPYLTTENPPQAHFPAQDASEKKF